MLNAPGKPWKNGADESINGKLRDECVSAEWFHSLREAKVVIETWRQHYNEVKLHSSLQYLTPTEFKQQLRQDLQPTVFWELLSRNSRAGQNRYSRSFHDPGCWLANAIRQASLNCL